MALIVLHIANERKDPAEQLRNWEGRSSSATCIGDSYATSALGIYSTCKVVLFYRSDPDAGHVIPFKPNPQSQIEPITFPYDSENTLSSHPN
jgi:hypothetical protein